MQDKDKIDRVVQAAADNPLLMVQVSPRRYIVARVDRGGSLMKRLSADTYFAHRAASVAFGPATWNQCLHFIADHSSAYDQHANLIPAA